MSSNYYACSSNFWDFKGYFGVLNDERSIEYAKKKRAESIQWREKWLAAKQYEPRFFKEMEKHELKRYRGWDALIKKEGPDLTINDELKQYHINACSDVSLYNYHNGIAS